MTDSVVMSGGPNDGEVAPHPGDDLGIARDATDDRLSVYVETDTADAEKRTIFSYVGSVGCSDAAILVDGPFMGDTTGPDVAEVGMDYAPDGADEHRYIRLPSPSITEPRPVYFYVHQGVTGA